MKVPLRRRRPQAAEHRRTWTRFERDLCVVIGRLYAPPPPKRRSLRY